MLEPCVIELFVSEELRSEYLLYKELESGDVVEREHLDSFSCLRSVQNITFKDVFQLQDIRDKYYLEISEKGLSLCEPTLSSTLKTNEKGFKKSKLTKIHVDFVAGASQHRRKYGGGKGQSIAKAVGLNKGATPRVLDLTAGLGGDGFVLATMGCQVTLLERSPIAFLLLSDGLNRARLFASENDPELVEVLDRISLYQQDAYVFLNQLIEGGVANVAGVSDGNLAVKESCNERTEIDSADIAITEIVSTAIVSTEIVAANMAAPDIKHGNPLASNQQICASDFDVIYLDPMFPTRKKSAAVKKEMTVFHSVIGADADASKLLPPALAVANNRVVVKRPRIAPFLDDLKPNYQLDGKSSRYDIYTKKSF